MSTAPVSVVIPTHDRVEHLMAAVRSVLEQRPAPLEILVCDDCSRDGTADAVERLAAEDSRVRLLATPVASGGPALPRNLGLAAAEAPWVAFLDDDDRWLPGKLEIQLADAERWDLVAANALRRSDGRPYFAVAPDLAALPRDNIIITSTVLVRTALLRDAGGFPLRRSWQGIEDYAAWLELADRGARMRILDDCVVDYRDEGSGRFGAVATRRTHRQLASLHLRRWLRRPADPHRARRAASGAVTWLRN
jgi:glycosyltransferase involved in cell wall biosynthesis